MFILHLPILYHHTRETERVALLCLERKQKRQTSALRPTSPLLRQRYRSGHWLTSLVWITWGSSCPRLLLEPQRQNSALFSESLDNAAWNKTSYPVTITANQTASPTGYVDADLITPTAALSRHAVGQTTISATSGVVYTISAFFKKAVSQYVVLTDGGDSDWHIVTADLDSGTITNQTNATGTITSYSNGWYRVTCTFTRVTTSFIFLYVGASNVSNATSLPSFNDVTLTTYVWGCQSEASASYASSYINTLGAAVTRGVDAASKTGISSLIGQTEGTLFADFEFNGNYDISGNIPINIYTSNSEAYIFISSAGNLFLDIVVAGALSARISGVICAVGRKKIAFAYKANDFVGYMNGIQIGTDTSGSVGAMGSLSVGAYKTTGYSTTGGVNQALVFKTRLSNADLLELTSL